ncbi:MAG: GNAT family N-acetyltransferase [bacterium]
MKPPKTLSTKRLSLRQVRRSDAKPIFTTYAQDHEATRYLVWRPHRDIEETREFIQRCAEAWQKGTEFTWAICLRDNTLIGCIALRIDGFKADTGYVIARPFWGKGFASEALKAVVDWAMQQPWIFRVWAVCDVENPASARVMEKVGMKKEGLLRRWIIHPHMSSAPRDCLCYSRVK